MSRETTQARIERDGRGRAWAFHVIGCPVCARSRRTACPTGRGLLDELEAANREVERQRELDTQPTSGQLPLW